MLSSADVCSSFGLDVTGFFLVQRAFVIAPTLSLCDAQLPREIVDLRHPPSRLEGTHVEDFPQIVLRGDALGDIKRHHLGMVDENGEIARVDVSARIVGANFRAAAESGYPANRRRSTYPDPDPCGLGRASHHRPRVR